MNPHPLGLPSDESPAADVARDMVRRGLLALPPVVGVVWLTIDGPSAFSVAYAMVLVMANFLLSAYLLRWAARIALGLIPSVALGGYVMRLALIFLAVWMVREASWVRMVPLGVTIIASHLGLLAWELRYVSASFAHPGLKPSRSQRGSGRPAVGYGRKRVGSDVPEPSS